MQRHLQASAALTAAVNAPGLQGTGVETEGSIPDAYQRRNDALLKGIEREHDQREVFDGLRHSVKAGAPWRRIPNDLSPLHPARRRLVRAIPPMR